MTSILKIIKGASIKRDHPDILENFNITLDEYPRRCEVQIAGWEILKHAVEDPETELDQEALAKQLKAAGAHDHEITYVKDLFPKLERPNACMNIART